MRWEKWNGDCIVPLSNQSIIYWLNIFIDWLRPRRDDFNRVFVPLNGFFSTVILNPLVRNWDWVQSSNHIHRVPRKTVYYGRSPSVVVCCVEVGWLSGRLVSINKGNQRSSQLRWFIFVQIAYWQMRSNVLKWVGRLRSWRPKFLLYHAAQILSSVFLHKF